MKRLIFAFLCIAAWSLGIYFTYELKVVKEEFPYIIVWTYAAAMIIAALFMPNE